MHAPFLTALRDSDGDGVADERRDLLTGLGLPPEKNPLAAALRQRRGRRARRLALPGPGRPRLRCAAARRRPAGAPRRRHPALPAGRPRPARLRHRPAEHLRRGPRRGAERLRARQRERRRRLHDPRLLTASSAPITAIRTSTTSAPTRPCRRWPTSAAARRRAGSATWSGSSRPSTAATCSSASGAGRSCATARRARAAASRRSKEIEFAAGADDDPYGFKPTDLVVQRDGSLIVADWADGQRPKRGRGRIYRITAAGQPTPPLVRQGTASRGEIARLDSESYAERCEAQGRLERRGAEGLAAVRDAIGRARSACGGGCMPCGSWPARADRPRSTNSWSWPGPTPTRASRPRPSGPWRTSPTRCSRGIASRAGRATATLAARLAALAEGRDPRVTLEVTIAVGRLRWAGTPAWLRKTLRQPDAALAHAAMQALRRSGNWPAVLALLDGPDAAPTRALALRALADRAEPVVVDGLIARLEAETRPGPPSPVRRPAHPGLQEARALGLLGIPPGPAPGEHGGLGTDRGDRRGARPRAGRPRRRRPARPCCGGCSGRRSRPGSRRSVAVCEPGRGSTWWVSSSRRWASTPPTSGAACWPRSLPTARREQAHRLAALALWPGGDEGSAQAAARRARGRTRRRSGARSGPGADHEAVPARGGAARLREAGFAGPRRPRGGRRGRRAPRPGRRGGASGPIARGPGPGRAPGGRRGRGRAGPEGGGGPAPRAGPRPGPGRPARRPGCAAPPARAPGRSAGRPARSPTARPSSPHWSASPSWAGPPRLRRWRTSRSGAPPPRSSRSRSAS